MSALRLTVANGGLASHTHIESPSPFQRMVATLESGRATLLIRAAENVPSDWLTAERIVGNGNVQPLGDNDVEVWRIEAGLWALATRVPYASGDPESTLHLNSLRKTVLDGLTAAWSALESTAVESVAPSPASSDPAFVVTPVACVPSLLERDQNLTDLNALLDTIVNKRLTVQFQPLVSMRDGNVFGYEALIRGPKGAALRRPGQMFRTADKARMVAWFDLACLQACFERAAEGRLNRLLFVNMDAEGLAYVDLDERSLKVRATEQGLDPANIVIELTERQTVEDYPGLRDGIARLREQGFRIAVDDAGAGYSSLNVIADLRPDFIKLDQSLIRGIDVNGAKRALINAFGQYARTTGTSILAEGIETLEELSALIDLGVSHGQGYLLGKPSDDFRGVARRTREFMRRRSERYSGHMSVRGHAVGTIARAGLSLPADTVLADALRRFQRDAGLSSIVVVETHKPRGLVMRSQLEGATTVAAGAGALSILTQTTLGRWARIEGLVVFEDDPIEEVARQTSARSDISLDTDIIVVNRDGLYRGVVSVRELVEAVRSGQDSRERYSDSLTGLPGRVVLERAVNQRLESRSSIAVVRMDITGLDAFNRRYGIESGDALIIAVARLLKKTSEECGEPDDLIAHLGGDDLMLVTRGDRAIAICKGLTSGFGAIAEGHRSHTRDGSPDATAAHEDRLASAACRLTVAAVTNRTRRFTEFSQMPILLDAMLAHSKNQPGSRYTIDRFSS